MIVNTLFALILVILSAVLMRSHWRSWLDNREEEKDERGWGFCWRQFRRRMQASAMIGIIGGAIFVGQYLSISVGALVYWMIVVFLGLWILLLGFADLLSTRLYIAELRREQIIQHARLRAEMRKRQGGEGNEE